METGPRNSMRVLFVVLFVSVHRLEAENSSMDSRQNFGHAIRDVFAHWNIPLKEMTIVFDGARNDAVFSILENVEPSTSLLFHEIKEGESVDIFLPRVVNTTDSRYFVLAMDPQRIRETIKKAVEMNMYFACYIWIVLLDAEVVQKNDVCRDVELDMNIFIIQNDETNNIISIAECHINKTVRSVTETMSWNSKDGLRQVSGSQRRPSSEYCLRVVVLPEAPWVYQKGSSYSGYNVDILDHIARSVGFTYVLLDCDQSLYGSYDEAASQWTGCVSDLVYGRADLIAAPLHLVSQREVVIDYIIPWLGYSGITILAEQTSRELFFFVQVFSTEVWLAVIASLLTSSTLVFAYGKILERYRWEENDAPKDESHRQLHNNINFAEAVWFFASSTAFEGTRRVPQSHASRILIAGFWLFTNIFMSVFVGNMAAFLMTSRLKTEINSVSDLIKQHTVHYSVWRDSSVAMHIKNMKSIEVFFDEKWTNDTLNSEELPPKELRVWKYPLQVQYSTLWDRIVQHGFVNTTEDALQRIKQGNYMFITDSAVAEFLAGSNCNLKVIGKKFSARPYGFGIKKYSSIKDAFAKAFLELQHSSKMHELRKKWWTRTESCPGFSFDKGLQMSEMAGQFYILLSGSIMGITLLVIEVCFMKARERKDNSDE